MKIVINTNYKSAGTRVCVDDLTPKLIQAGHEVVRNDWNNYRHYELVLFMAPDSEVRKAKRENPTALVGIMDPKVPNRKRIEETKKADFLVVSSIEQRDFFLRYNQNIFIYLMFPDVPALSKEHQTSAKILIGYHGNKLHLNSMTHLSQALDALSAKYPLEFRAIYDVQGLGQWRKNRPQKCLVKDIQWKKESFLSDLNQCDIGVAPEGRAINAKRGKFFSRFVSSIFNNWPGYNKDDYLIRFKYSANPGRIYVFSQAGLPVVADFTPSNCQIIQNGWSGYLVYAKEGWYNALEQLILSFTLRQEMSDNLKNFIAGHCSVSINFQRFLEFITSPRTKAAAQPWCGFIKKYENLNHRRSF